MPEGQFRIERKAYQRFLEECYLGDMSYLKLYRKDSEQEFTNVVFFGANYLDSYPIKNLYKALNIFKPDALLVKLRPDLLLDNFKLEGLRSKKE